MKKWLSIITIVLVVIYLVVGFVLAPYLIKHKAPEFVHQATGGNLTIGDVSFNPLVFELNLHTIEFKDPDGKEFISLSSIQIGVDPFMMVDGLVQISTVVISQLQVKITRERDGSFSYDWLIADETNSTTKESSSGDTLAFRINNFLLDDAKIEFVDLSKTAPLHLVLNQTSIKFNDFDTRDLSSSKELISISTLSSDGESVDVKVDLHSLEPVALSADLDIDGLRVYNIWHFVQELTQLEVADGAIDLNLSCELDLSDLQSLLLEDISLDVNSLRLRPKGESGDIFRAKNVSVNVAKIEPLSSSMEIDRVGISGINAYATRLKSGNLDWVELLNIKGDESNSSTSTSSDKPLEVVVREIVVKDANFDFIDQFIQTQTTTTINSLELYVKGASTIKSRPITIESRFVHNIDKGVVQSSGILIQEPLSIELSLGIDSLMLEPFSPYIEEFSYLRVQDGSISTESRLSYGSKESGADLVFSGDLTISDFLSMDKRDEMPVLALSRLKTSDILLNLNPNRLFVEKVELDSLYTTIQIDENRSLNLTKLLKSSGDTNSTDVVQQESNTTTSFPYVIVRTLLSNGTFHFADYSLPLQFNTYIHSLDGEILGVSSKKSAVTRVELRGAIDRYGVVKIDGSLRANDIPKETDIGLYFRNIDLSSFSPYSGKFIGQLIDRGKLDVKMRYKIKDSQLSAENSLSIKKIEMGDDFQSKDAVSLPLSLALALLEDSNGVIDIDMPVRGDINDPDFKWGGVVWGAFVNVITKAVTAPFSFLGKMLGFDADELKNIEFEPASWLVDPPSIERLETVASALKERPKLSLSIAGGYSTTLDTKAIKVAALHKQVLEIEDKSSVDRGADLEIELFEQIYKSRFGDNNLSDFKNSETNSTIAQYRKKLIDLLVDSQPIPDDSLEVLSRSRAEEIFSYLNKILLIDEHRLQIKASVPVEPDNNLIPTQLSLDVAK